MKNYYKILGVKPNVNEQELKKAYRKVIAQCHPDRQASKEEKLQGQASEINEAFSFLSNPKKRKRLDEWLSLRDENNQKHQASENVSPFSNNREEPKVTFGSELRKNLGLGFMLFAIVASVSYNAVNKFFPKQTEKGELTSERQTRKIKNFSISYRAWLNLCNRLQLSTESKVWERLFLNAKKHHWLILFRLYKKASVNKCLSAKEKKAYFYLLFEVMESPTRKRMAFVFARAKELKQKACKNSLK